jgi:hypothetical protein
VQGTKKAIKITLSEEEKKRIEALIEKSKYKNSEEAKEKREALRKKKNNGERK